MRPLRLALAQMNPTVGDLEGNADVMLALMGQAVAAGADLIAFPELAVTGYPPEDLLFKHQFIEDARAALDRVVAASSGIVAVIGAPDAVDGKLYNAAAVAHDGKLVAIYHKIFLPNYGVFDEARYFEPGRECPVLTVAGVRVGVNVCEDIWYDVGPATVQRVAGAEVIVNINGSPYHRGKGRERQEMLAGRARDHGAFIAYVNMVGGQDELVFDGQSLVMSPEGELVARAPQFQEALLFADVDADRALPMRLTGFEERLSAVGEPKHYALGGAPPDGPGSVGPPGRPDGGRAALEPEIGDELDPLAEVYAALVAGTRDYVRKTGFTGAVIGLSGGIDSALTTAIAVDALGPDAVTTFFMPSQYTAGQSADDAAKLASNLGVRMQVIPIDGVRASYMDELGPLFAGREPDVTEENLQARIRGNLLMAASNKFGWIVLTTGNKSEMATGYATLYGDMAGGFAVIKDVPKTLVFELARHRNEAAGREDIPESIIVRPPTAELRPDQKDEDSLPPYATLDPVLEAYVEQDRSREDMLAAGMAPSVVDQTMRLVDRSEYKRRQAPPGVKITRRNFGRDRRLPLVNHYKGTALDPLASAEPRSQT